MSINSAAGQAAKNKITYSTTLFGYSEITIQDMDEKILAIVQDVIRRRAGYDNVEISDQDLLEDSSVETPLLGRSFERA